MVSRLWPDMVVSCPWEEPAEELYSARCTVVARYGHETVIYTRDFEDGTVNRPAEIAFTPKNQKERITRGSSTFILYYQRICLFPRICKGFS